ERGVAERERRGALEREHAALQDELTRRTALTDAAAVAIGEARRELERERAARADSAALEARLIVERREFAARVEAVESAVAAVRQRLGAAARVLREKLDAERAAREAAEAALSVERADAAAARARGVELEDELARRVEVEAQLRAALDGLRTELEAVRAGDGARAARLATRVESVVAIAAGLRDGVRRELGAEQEAFTASLSAMQARVAELQEGVAAAAAVREELEAERAARWVAEAELDAERRRGDEDRARRTFAEARLADAEAELEELRDLARPGGGPDPAGLAALRDALAHLKTPAPPASSTDEPAGPTPLGLDLAAAAARLRSAARAAEAEDEATPEAEVAPEPEAAAVEAEPAPEVVSDVEVEPELAAPEPELAAPEPELAPAPEPTSFASWDESISSGEIQSSLDAAAAAEPEPAPEPVRAPLAARPPVTRPGTWLRDALVGLAVDEPDIAELLVVALLPAQGGLVRRPLAYELAVHGGTTHRVVLDAERARVQLPGDGETEARVAGPLAALVPLVAGGAGRRLPGTVIQNRRALRRLLKARRRPLGLAELSAAGVAPSPGLLLTVLARAVPPAWTEDRPLAVDIAPAGADRWRVVSSGNGPMTILPAAGAAPAVATLHTSAARLPAVLAGTAGPGDAWVEGDPRAVSTLLSWFDRAQRGDR
ncbi:MAG: hypothetical protein QOF26_2965, partial [Baekduia sp.]|nr:hypothetical protein [Baekduia sp.]